MRTLNREFNVPGSVVSVAGTWYRIAASGSFVRATAREVQNEITKRELTSEVRTKV